MEELKLSNCPCCGSEIYAEIIEPHKHYFCSMPDYKGGAVAECKCGLCMMCETFEELRAKWNNRAEKWIPATEPPEEKEEKYLVFAEFNDGSVDTVYNDQITKFKQYFTGWMPLPKSQRKNK
jgi:hypothetical protein